MEKTSKVVVITGASSGIGNELANLYAKNGHIVYGVGQRTLENTQFNYYKVNISNPENCEEFINEVISKHKKIDILINNAGMGISAPIENTNLSDAKKLFDVNFFGSVNMVKCVLPHMRKANSGHIVNVSSVASFVPIPFQIFYSASKAALDAFASGLRSEIKDYKIQVTCVHPGDVKTGFTASRKKELLDSSNPYSKNYNSAVGHMEHDEQNGMSAAKVAKKIYKISFKKHTRATNVIGGKYKLMCALLKIFNPKLREAIVRKFYY